MSSLFGARRAAGRGRPAGPRARRLPRRPRPRTRWRRRSCAARTRTPGSLDIDVSAALDVDGLVAIYTYEDLPAELARAAAAADPAPGADPRPHAVPAGQGRGQPRRRGHRHGRRHATATWPRTPPTGSTSATRSCPPWSASTRPGQPSTSCIADVPGNVAANSVQEHGDAAAVDRRRPARAGARPAHRAVRVDPDGGPRRAGPLGSAGAASCASGPRPRPPPACARAVAAKLDLALTDVDVITPDVGGGFGVKIMHPWPEEVLVPWAARQLRGR